MMLTGLLYVISFFGGFQIMLLEVCGFRMLQTNLGSSVVVTGTLLTLVMVLLSGGYYAGGRLSGAGVRLLLVLLLLGTVYTHVCNVLYPEVFAAWGLDLRDRLYGDPVLESGVPAAFLSLALYGPPVVAMSMISPVLIRLRTGDGAGDAGRSAGFFMALSTVGSIVGTMVGSYWLIPFHGVTVTVASANAVFAFILAVGYVLTGGAKWVRALVGLGALAIGWSSYVAVERNEPPPGVVFERDSFYGSLRVVATEDDAGRRLLEYQPSRVYTHSVLYPDEPLREIAGLQYLVAPASRPPREILVLGSAAGGVIRQIEQIFPDAAVTGVDIDPLVNTVARDQFQVDPRRVTLVARDARVFLDETSRTYDLIIVDLFSGEFIPPHCISVEFFRLVRERLAPDGTLFVNTNMNDVPYDVPRGVEPFRPIRHLQSTLLAAGFPAQFENRFFHAVHAYPYPMSEDRFIGELERHFRDVDEPQAVRVAAGLAALVSAAVPAGRERYRPFTDRWVPAPLIELKSNEQRIYAALGRTAAVDSVADPAAAQLLRQILDEGERLGYFTALRDPAALVARLDGWAGSQQPVTRSWAARFLRFSPEMPPDDAAGGRSPLAALASRYALLYRLALANDYEALLGPVGVLIEAFSGAKAG